MALGWWTQDSRVVGSIPTPGVVRLKLKLRQFHLPQFASVSLQMSTNIVGKVPAMD